MKRRFIEEQIIGILKQQESGMKTADVCQEHNPSTGHPAPTPSTPGRANMGHRVPCGRISQAQRLGQLEAE